MGAAQLLPPRSIGIFDFEPDIAAINWATAEKLEAGGCAVRMGPRNQTLHIKLSIFDLIGVTLGSHNMTRGGLGFNGEGTIYLNTRKAALWATKYFDTKWVRSTRKSQSEPPTSIYLPVTIRLQSAATVGEAVTTALYDAYTDGKRHITTEDISQSLLQIIPVSVTMKEQIEDLRSGAASRACPASRAPEPVLIPSYVERRMDL